MMTDPKAKRVSTITPVVYYDFNDARLVFVEEILTKREILRAPPACRARISSARPLYETAEDRISHGNLIKIARGFQSILLRHGNADEAKSALEAAKKQYPALRDLTEDSKVSETGRGIYEGLLLRVAQRFLRSDDRTVAYLMMYLQAFLSFVDVLSDVYMVAYFAMNGQGSFALGTAASVAANLLLQIIVVLAMHSKKKREEVRIAKP